MKLEEYPKVTVILRGYTFEQAMLVIEILSDFHQAIGVEVTTNNQDYLKVINEGKKSFGKMLPIGVGTVLTIEQAEQAIKAGADFMLGPQKFSKEIFTLAKEEKVLTIPGAMSPGEIYEMFQNGANIVKVFPATALRPKYFEQIQGPFGKLPLMAVGGINHTNARDYLEKGASYIGVGSGLFNQDDIDNFDHVSLKKSVTEFMKSLVNS